MHFQDRQTCQNCFASHLKGIYSEKKENCNPNPREQSVSFESRLYFKRGFVRSEVNRKSQKMFKGFIFLKIDILLPKKGLINWYMLLTLVMLN